MAALKDFLIGKDRAPRFLQQVAENFKRGDGQIQFGKSDTFGYFILLVSKKDGARVVWVETNRMFMAQFLEMLADERPIKEYEKNVTAQRPKGSKKEDAMAYPRIYVDSGLKEAGFEPGDKIRVKINKARQQVTIEKVQTKQ